MQATGKQLENPDQVMRRAYGTKLKSLRRKELERLFAIHGIQHGDMVKDDLVRLGEGVEAMGYDLWRRPEQQSKPQFPTFSPTVADNIEGSGQGRTTSETLQQPVPPPAEEPPAVPPGDPVAAKEDRNEPASDEWVSLRALKLPQLRKMVKAFGMHQTPKDDRMTLTTRLQAHCSTIEVEKWIADNVEDKDAS